MKHLLLGLIILGWILQPASAAYGITGQFTDSLGQARSFSNYEGNYLFLEAFSTTCVHCQNQHPTLEDIYDTFGSQLYMLSLSTNPQDTLQTLASYRAEYPTPWDMGLDTNGNFANRYSITGTPTIVLFDPYGFVLEFWVGETGYAELEEAIAAALLNNLTATNTTPPVIGSGGVPEDLLTNVLTNPILLGGIAFSLVIAIYFKSTGKK